MIYLKRLWNIIAIFFAGCVFILTAPLLLIEIFVITPIEYILQNELYIAEHYPFPFRVMWWLASKLMFNTNKK